MHTSQSEGPPSPNDLSGDSDKNLTDHPGDSGKWLITQGILVSLVGHREDDTRLGPGASDKGLTYHPGNSDKDLARNLEYPDMVVTAQGILTHAWIKK